MIVPGMYPLMSNEDYHGHKESISRSAIMEFLKSPRHYWARYLNSERPDLEITSAMKLGSAFHTFILEPPLFFKLYSVLPTPCLAKEVGKEIYKIYKDNVKMVKNSGQIILKEEEYDLLKKMAIAVMKIDEAKELLTNALIETSYFWIDQDSGLLVKARPDALKGGIYVDLKTIDDASPRNFQASMIKGGYHIQGAMAQDALLATTGEVVEMVINICVEKKYPYSVGIYEIDNEALEYGRSVYKKALIEMRNCQQKNEYPGYAIQTINLPKWARE